MQNVVINGLKSSITEYSMKLNNGDLLLWQDANGGVKESFIVTSFRNNKGNNTHWDVTASYCSLINLDNGTIFFEEACSRATTNIRVLKHLNRFGYNRDNTFRNSAGEQLKVFRKGNYSINISLG